MPDQELDITLEEEDDLDIALDEERELDIGLEPGIVKVPTGDIVHVNTTAVWNSTPMLVANSKHIYVYSDYVTSAGESVPGIKIGDGTSYLIDMPFVEGNDSRLTAHIRDTIVHVTAADRELWDNKVTCYISPVDSERLVFSKAKEE